MRVFGWVFAVLGVAFAVISFLAVLDPNSIYEGTARFEHDPWVNGITLGVALALVGALVLRSASKMSPESRSLGGRVIAAIVFGVVGFVLFMPAGAVSMCSDGVKHGFCRQESWSTFSGLTFEGENSYGLAFMAGAAGSAATIAFYLIRDRLRLRSQAI